MLFRSIAARGMVLREDGLMQFAPPLKLSDHDFAIRQVAPQAGEHQNQHDDQKTQIEERDPEKGIRQRSPARRR